MRNFEGVKTDSMNYTQKKNVKYRERWEKEERNKEEKQRERVVCREKEGKFLSSFSTLSTTLQKKKNRLCKPVCNPPDFFPQRNSSSIKKKIDFNYNMVLRATSIRPYNL